MKAEKFILSIIGIFFGLLVAGSAFYFWQRVTSHPTKEKNVIGTTITKAPTPSPTPSFFLNIDDPKDESVTDNKTVTISGTTIPTATVVVSTGSNDQVVAPSSQGSFSTTATLDDGENQLILTAIAPSGEEVKKTITVTYSTEEF